MKKTIITCALMALVAISANAQDKTESVFKYDKYGNIVQPGTCGYKEGQLGA